jgi:alcohol dehydrogenase (cytochrome c)
MSISPEAHNRSWPVFLQTAEVMPGGLGTTSWPAWRKLVTRAQETNEEYREGKRFVGGAPGLVVPALRGAQIRKPEEKVGYGVVRAMDPKTGERKWEYKMNDVTASGILTTASDLLFTGGREGFFQALDARDGKLLWKIAAGGEIAMGPMTYSVSGKQYVVFSSGGSLFVYGLR